MPKLLFLAGNGFSAFDKDGALSDGRQAKMLEATVDEMIKTTRSLS